MPQSKRHGQEPSDVTAGHGKLGRLDMGHQEDIEENHKGFHGK